MRTILRPFQAITLLAVAAVLTACASNPIAIAETPLQTAYAIERSYNIILEQAVELAERQPNLRASIVQIEQRTTPIVESLSVAITDYVEARAQFALGETTEQRIAIVGGNLENWIRQAQRALVDLAAALD